MATVLDTTFAVISPPSDRRGLDGRNHASPEALTVDVHAAACRRRVTLVQGGTVGSGVVISGLPGSMQAAAFERNPIFWRSEAIYRQPADYVLARRESGRLQGARMAQTISSGRTCVTSDRKSTRLHS